MILQESTGNLISQQASSTMGNFWGTGAGRHRGFDFPGVHKESGAKVIAWGHRNQQTLG